MVRGGRKYHVEKQSKKWLPVSRLKPSEDAPEAPLIREFETGATRDSDVGKLDYEGFFSPIVLERQAQYMHKHRLLPDGSLRGSDNWQLGIRKDVYMKSLLRHIMDLWKQFDGFVGQDTLQDTLCAIVFNASGYLFEDLKEGYPKKDAGGWTSSTPPTIGQYAASVDSSDSAKELAGE
jgi:hypothetical protein